MTFPLPTSPVTTGTTGHINDHNNIAADIKTLGNARTDWLNVTGPTYNADPTGVSDSTTAIQNALNAAPAGGVVYVPAGAYVISSQLTVPVGVLFKGDQGFRAAARNNSRILPSASFSGASAITMGAGTPSAAIADLVFDGTNLPGGNAVDGIDLIGAIKQWSLTGVVVRNFGGHGLNIAQSGGNNPDGGLIRELSVTNCALDGVHWAYCVDSLAYGIHSDSNTGTGIWLNNMNNTILANCKSQQNQTGYIVTGNSVRPNGTFSACFSENNLQHGWTLGSMGSSGGGTITLVGCSTRDDGTSGSSGSGYAGFNLTSISNVDVLIDNATNFLTTSANGPDYGIKATSCTSDIVITGGSLTGSVAPYNDGGGNTRVTWLGTATGVGQSDSTQVSAPPALHLPGPALGTAKPSDFGAISETFPYLMANTAGQVPVSGTPLLAAIAIPRQVTTSISLTFETFSSAGSGAVAGQNFIGLYKFTGGAAIGSTGIDSVVGGSLGAQAITVTLSSPLAPGLYWAVILFNATTPPTLRRAAALSQALTNYSAANTVSRAGTYSTLLTALPSITPSSITQTNTLIYVLAR